MSIDLIIDKREHGLIKELSDSLQFLEEQLDVGDIIFRRGEEDILIIERKTLQDLKASICDGRLREQKSRLLANFPRERIMYLVEGDISSRKLSSNGIPPNTLIGSMINTMLRDGIMVYRTTCLTDSVIFIKKLLSKLNNDGEKYFSNSTVSQIDYVSSIKKKKKSNMNPANWLMAQLSLIPQVTEKVASKIMEEYPTLISLIYEYEKTPQPARASLLAEIKYPIKNGKFRRVGEKMSTRIYSYIYGLE